VEARNSSNIPDYEDRDFVIDDAEADMEIRIIHELLPSFSRWSVDLGCGYGRLSGALSRKSGKLILVDYSMTGMKRARQKMLDDGIPASFLLADISHLPFKSDSIDTVAMFRVFHHFNDPALAIQEIVRCMRPSGHMVFNYNSSDNASMMLFWLKQRINGGNSHQKFPFPLKPGTLRASPEDDRRPIYFQTHSTVRSLIRKNGLVQSHRNFHSGMLGRVASKNSFFQEAARDLQTRMLDKWPSRFLFPNNYVLCRKEGRDDGTEFHKLEDLLACPVCSGTIFIEDDSIECANGHRFTISNGIYDFRNPS
jgi:SAM-dependent methyltransferase